MPSVKALEVPQKCILGVEVTADQFVVWSFPGLTSKRWLQSAHIIIVCERVLVGCKVLLYRDTDVREAWRRYVLAVPEYIQFTSAIRRYPDVIVQRLLANASGQL